MNSSIFKEKVILTFQDICITSMSYYLY